jgi:hypothetical protein
MLVLIGALLIIIGAFAMAAIYKLIDSLLLATILQLVLLAAVIGIFTWLR